MAKQCAYFVMFVIAISYMIVESTAQSQHGLHIVGGSEGWTIPPNKTFYEDWTAKKTIKVGDKLMFLYHTSIYNIIQVSKEDFDNCDDKNVINRWYLGPTIINITEPGMHYYYDSIGLHCEAGQKLAIDVKSASYSTSGARIAASHGFLLGFLAYFVYLLV